MNDGRDGAIPELRGRHLLVTGAGSGIGLATAAALRRHGARVAAAVQDASQADAVRTRVPDAAVLVQDLRDDAGCAARPSGWPTTATWQAARATRSPPPRPAPWCSP